MWIRVNAALGDDPVVHRAAFTYASDMSLLGATLTAHETRPPEVQMASLDHAIWFHRPFRADEWWLYDQVSPSASGGRGLALARVFTQDGRLVATVAQEGLIRLAR
jgi:acyl-CoA thioesterase-2